jgi:hypothetical protein
MNNDYFEKKTKRCSGDMAVMIRLLDYLESFKPVCGGVLDDDEGFYYGYLPQSAPALIENDKDPSNESGVIVRTIDIPFLKIAGTGDWLQIRAVIAGYTEALAAQAEQRMRAGIKRMQAQAEVKNLKI